MGRFDSLLSDTRPFFSWSNKWFRMTVYAVGFILLLTLIIVLAVRHKGPASPNDLADQLKYDCHPDQQETNQGRIEANCKARGCVWLDHNKKDSLIPKCFFPADYVNYEVKSSNDVGRNKVIILGKTRRSTGFLRDVSQIKVEINDIDNDRLRLRITDVESNRWEPPLPILNNIVHEKPEGQNQYDVSIADGILMITRKRTGSLIIKTDLKKLIFADRFIQLINEVPSNSLYGLGETLDNHEKKVITGQDKDGRKRIKLFNYGDHPIREKASYGTHPFYLMYETKPTDAHGVLLINSNAMDIIMTHTPSLTYRVIGGVLDFYIFMGPTAMDVIARRRN